MSTPPTLIPGPCPAIGPSSPVCTYVPGYIVAPSSGIIVRWRVHTAAIGGSPGKLAPRVFRDAGIAGLTAIATGSESQDACPSVASRQAAPCVDAPPPVALSCKVPKLKGLTKAKAKKAIVPAGCKLGKTTKKKANKGKKGRATKQSPAAGKVVAAGTAVTLTLKK